MILCRMAKQGIFGLFFFSAACINADESTENTVLKTVVTKHCTTTLMDEKMQHWAAQHLPLMNMHDRQILANTLCFLHLEARSAHTVQQHAHRLITESYQSYRSLSEKQDANKNLTNLEECCKQLAAMQREFFAITQIRAMCENAHASLDPKEHEIFFNAIEGLRKMGQDLAYLLGEDVHELTQDINGRMLAEIEQTTEFLRNTGEVCRPLGSINEPVDYLKGLYTLRALTTQCVNNSWKFVGLHLDTDFLDSSFIEMSAYLFYLGYRAAYEGLDDNHKTIIENITINAKNELPNPVIFTAQKDPL
jgi:hypothetical protein